MAYSESMATMLAAPQTATVAPRRWTVEEFDRLPDDLFGGDRVELIDGQIYIKMGQGFSHITAIQLVFAALQAAFGEGFNVSMQLPVGLNDGSKPEPDVRVLRGGIRDYEGRYPDPATEIALVVEVSETSLAYDLGPKLSMYAANGVPEYWVLDLASRALQVCRRPRPERGEYAETLVLREGERATVRGSEIAVDSLLPRA